MAQIITILTIAFLSFTDQVIKLSVIKELAPDGEFVLIDNVFRLRYIENSGAVFGSLQSSTKILAIVTGVVIFVALYMLLSKRVKNKFLYFCLVLVLSGGIGNLIDRVFRGYVVDYFEPLFIDFAIFNFADCLVTVGAFAMIGYLVIDLIKDLRKAKNE